MMSRRPVQGQVPRSAKEENVTGNSRRIDEVKSQGWERMRSKSEIVVFYLIYLLPVYRDEETRKDRERSTRTSERERDSQFGLARVRGKKIVLQNQPAGRNLSDDCTSSSLSSFPPSRVIKSSLQSAAGTVSNTSAGVPTLHQ